MVTSDNFEDLIEASSKSHPLNLPSIKENALQIHYEDVGTEVHTVFSGVEPPLPFAKSKLYDVCICQTRRLTAAADGCKAIYEVTFNITNCDLNFYPGDTIGIIPHNDDEDIKFVINHLNLTAHADLMYNLTSNTSQKGAKIPPHVPVRSTLRHILQNYLDLRTVVKKLFLLALTRHTKDGNERRVLEYLCSKEGSRAYTTHILNKNMCILDIFSIFKSCKPTVEVLLANLPRLLPRPYSIVNRNTKNMLKICFSVMNLENNRKGLVTGWLEKIIMKENSIESQLHNLKIDDSIGPRIPLYLRKNMSEFLMPVDTETPLLLIGPGTGVSPFIGFLEERQYQKENLNLNFGKIWLFFGCRNPKLDFIYEKELKAFLLNGSLSKLSTSFSRIESSLKYVQDAIMADGEEIIKYINNGASIFVCGDVKNMATQVKQALINCLVKYDGKSSEEAEKQLSVMQTGKRYFTDIWY